MVEKKGEIGDYTFVRKLGEGAYGSVNLMQDCNNELFAIKCIDKKDILKLKKQESVIREKNLLLKLQNNPFIVKLYKTFSDEDSLYFVFEHCQNGTLSELIKEKGKLDPEVAL